MAGRFIALLMVAVAAHLGRGANPTTAAAADTPAVPIAHVERLVGEWALTMLVVVAAWVVLAVAASVLRRLPGSVGRLAGLVWRMLVPAALRATLVTIAGVQVAVPCVASAASDVGSGPGPEPAVVTGSLVLDRPVTSVPPRSESARTRPSRTSTVTVQPGDSLWSIARRDLGGSPGADEIAEHWPRWYQHNRATIGPEPDLITVGMTLLAPPATGGRS